MCFFTFWKWVLNIQHFFYYTAGLQWRWLIYESQRCEMSPNSSGKHRNHIPRTYITDDICLLVNVNESPSSNLRLMQVNRTQTRVDRKCAMYRHCVSTCADQCLAPAYFSCRLACKMTTLRWILVKSPNNPGNLLTSVYTDNSHISWSLIAVAYVSVC